MYKNFECEKIYDSVSILNYKLDDYQELEPYQNVLYNIFNIVYLYTFFEKEESDDFVLKVINLVLKLDTENLDLINSRIVNYNVLYLNEYYEYLQAILLPNSVYPMESYFKYFNRFYYTEYATYVAKVKLSKFNNIDVIFETVFAHKNTNNRLICELLIAYLYANYCNCDKQIVIDKINNFFNNFDYYYDKISMNFNINITNDDFLDFCHDRDYFNTLNNLIITLFENDEIFNQKKLIML